MTDDVVVNQNANMLTEELVTLIANSELSTAVWYVYV